MGRKGLSFILLVIILITMIACVSPVDREIETALLYEHGMDDLARLDLTYADFLQRLDGLAGQNFEAYFHAEKVLYGDRDDQLRIMDTNDLSEDQMDAYREKLETQHKTHGEWIPSKTMHFSPVYDDKTLSARRLYGKHEYTKYDPTQDKTVRKIKYSIYSFYMLDEWQLISVKESSYIYTGENDEKVAAMEDMLLSQLNEEGVPVTFDQKVSY